ncbi:MAG: SRPBCC family protein [Candidatus Omnitrophica bacterium]|nr:SRPBCC family protein [Candidatus Omnitrophota bacterium]
MRPPSLCAALGCGLSLALSLAPVDAAETRSTDLGAHPLTYTIDWLSATKAHVTARLVIPSDADRVWAVLTDYDHLAEFVPYLSDSRLTRREANPLILHQEGGLWFPFYQLRSRVDFEVREEPREAILFKAVGGDFRVYEGSWRLSKVAEGTGLAYEATIEPDFWVPRWLLWDLERQILKGTFRAILRRCRREEAPLRGTSLDRSVEEEATPESSPAS